MVSPASQTAKNSQTKGNSSKVGTENYGVIVNIPVIIRERQIFDRKKTIDVFRTKRFHEIDKLAMGSVQGKQNNTEDAHTGERKSIKKKDDKIGKIYVNELWSEKFHKQVLKESKIREIVDKIERLRRRNLDTLIADVNNASIVKNLSASGTDLGIGSQNMLFSQHAIFSEQQGDDEVVETSIKMDESINNWQKKNHFQDVEKFGDEINEGQKKLKNVQQKTEKINGRNNSDSNLLAYPSIHRQYLRNLLSSKSDESFHFPALPSTTINSQNSTLQPMRQISKALQKPQPSLENIEGAVSSVFDEKKSPTHQKITSFMSRDHLEQNRKQISNLRKDIDGIIDRCRNFRSLFQDPLGTKDDNPHGDKKPFLSQLPSPTSVNSNFSDSTAAFLARGILKNKSPAKFEANKFMSSEHSHQSIAQQHAATQNEVSTVDNYHVQQGISMIKTPKNMPKHLNFSTEEDSQDELHINFEFYPKFSAKAHY